MSFAASSFICPNSKCMILSASTALHSANDARRASCHAATCWRLHTEWLNMLNLWGNCELRAQRQRLDSVRLGFFTLHSLTLLAMKSTSDCTAHQVAFSCFCLALKWWKSKKSNLFGAELKESSSASWNSQRNDNLCGWFCTGHVLLTKLPAIELSLEFVKGCDSVDLEVSLQNALKTHAVTGWAL